MPVGDYYDVTWGSARLWCARITTDNSRKQVIHEPAEGDDSIVQDRGRQVLKTTCELLFVEMPSESMKAIDRFAIFKAQVDEGARLLFVHPVDGGMYVNVENFSYSIDEDSNIDGVSCTFVKSADEESPSGAGPATALDAGAGAVSASADVLAAELETVVIPETSANHGALGTDALAAIDSWALPETTPTRQVIVDVAALSDRLATFIVEAGLEDDLALFPIYRATILLGSAIRAAALAALAETPKLTAILINTPISVLALCVRIYGGLEAADRTRQVLSLNDIRTPGWIPAGTVLMMPVPNKSRRAARAA